MANTSNLDLVKPAGTDHALISVINSNMDKVDAYAGKVNTSLAGVEDGLAIVATGNTHAAITAGQFVYVKEHNTLPEGLYTASSNIAANATLSTTNLTADSKGGLNALSDQIATISNYAKECTWVIGSTSDTGNVKAANYPTGYTQGNCYVEAAYFDYTTGGELYALPNAVVTVILKSDGIYVSTQQATFTGTNKFHFLLRKL